MRQYIEYIKKVFAWISDLSEEINVSKIYLFFDYLGAVIFHGCLIRQYRIGGFWSLSHAERKKRLTYPRMSRLMAKYNDARYIHYLEKKSDFNEFFSSFVKRDWLYIEDVGEEQLFNFLNMHKSVIIKPVNGVEGGGVRKYNYSVDDDVHEFYQKLRDEDVMVEECIVQHEDMCFENASVNTIRTMTLVDKNGKGHVVKAILRAGVGDTVADNYCLGGSIYEVDVETGVVCSRGKSKAGENHIYHPRTDMVMLGRKIPNWKDVIECSERAAESIPQISIVGWDIAIKKDGVDLIEGNHNPDYELYEFLGSAGYYAKFKKML